MADRGDPSSRRSIPPVRNLRRSPLPSRRTVREHLRALRESFTRTVRVLRRPMSVAIRLVAVAATLAGAVALGRLAVEQATTSPAFALRDVSVRGNRRVGRDAILQAGGLTAGTNIFTVDAAESGRRIERIPWIAHAEVTRRLPQSVTVEVRERRPAALAVLGAVYLVSDDASVFKRVTPDDPVDLPVITGIDRDHYLRDRAWAAATLLEAIALLHDYAVTGLADREAVQEIHVEADDGLSLYVGEDAIYVRLGRGPYRAKLARLAQVVQDLANRGARPAYVYLDGRTRPERVVVKLR